MTASILDGNATAGAIRAELTERVSARKSHGIKPGPGTVLVGDDPGTAACVNGKQKDCARVGIVSHRRDLPETASQEEVEGVIKELNVAPECTGYIVQSPLTRHLDTNRILELIDPCKDADGLHPVNLGRLVLGEPASLPRTARGIVELLTRHGITRAGANVCIIGRGVTVGRPLGLLLTRCSVNATVTLGHTGTKDLPDHLADADIVVAAGRFTASGDQRLPQAGWGRDRFRHHQDRAPPGRGRPPFRATRPIGLPRCRAASIR